MPLAEFELVMLESGEVALQRTGSDEPWYVSTLHRRLSLTWMGDMLKWQRV